LESFGLLNTKNGETADDRNASANTGNKSNFAVVELGAGRGYLSHMLCDCYNVQNVVMVERRSYKFKVSPPHIRPFISCSEILSVIENL
jgi:tRNA:m4X modification enzyme